MSPQLPRNPSLEHLKKQARDLQRAHQAGDTEALQLIRDHHPKIDGRPPLPQVADFEFSVQDAQLVLARSYQFKSWPDLVAEIEWTPLRHALEEAIDAGDVATVEDILGEHARLRDTHVSSRNWGTPLSHAAGKGKLEIVRALLPRSLEHAKHAFGRATLLGHIEVARYLLEQVPALRQELEFALFGPCESLKPDAIPMLIELGANPNAVWENGGTPMDMAICSYMKLGREATVTALVEGGAAYDDGAEMDIHMGRMESLAARLDEDPALVHRPSRFRQGREYGGLYGGAPLIGATLLHICAEHGAIEAARLLLARGADVNARCQPDDGVGDQTPLFHAINQKHEEAFPLMHLLLDEGADVNARATVRVPRSGLQCAQPDDPVLEQVTPLGYVLNYPNSLHHRAHDDAIQLLRDRGGVE